MPLTVMDTIWIGSNSVYLQGHHSRAPGLLSLRSYLAARLSISNTSDCSRQQPWVNFQGSTRLSFFDRSKFYICALEDELIVHHFIYKRWLYCIFRKSIRSKEAITFLFLTVWYGKCTVG